MRTAYFSKQFKRDVKLQKKRGKDMAKFIFKNIPGWKCGAGKKTLEVRVRCKDFLSAIRLMGRIARLAEAADHHPDLHLTRYRRLRIVLTTHEAGRVTSRDFALAKKIQKIVKTKQ